MDKCSLGIETLLVKEEIPCPKLGFVRAVFTYEKVIDFTGIGDRIDRNP
jgi:hypothetical protein